MMPAAAPTSGFFDHVEPGKNADLIVVVGDPSKNVSDIESVELVFKDGVAFDPSRLLESVRGRYGQYGSPAVR